MTDKKLKTEINKGDIKVFDLTQFYDKSGKLKTNIENLGGSTINTGRSFRTIRKEDAFEIAKNLNIKIEMDDKDLKSHITRELVKRNMWIKECPNLRKKKGKIILEMVNEILQK